MRCYNTDMSLGNELNNMSLNLKDKQKMKNFKELKRHAFMVANNERRFEYLGKINYAEELTLKINEYKNSSNNYYQIYYKNPIDKSCINNEFFNSFQTDDKQEFINALKVHVMELE
jgi:hypothetical protein